MTFAVIVQARFGSTRFPAKVLEDLGGAPVLKRCLDRCARIPGIDTVVCAIPDSPENDPVADAAASWDYQVVRGSEHDVLSRYAKAARDSGADKVMRITSDCPMIDPAISGEVARLLTRPGVDYACNNMPARFPHGLDCDAFDAEHLFDADRLADSPYDREHVTPWIRSNPALRKASLQGPGEPFTKMRWTLDHREDLAFMRAVYDELGDKAPDASAAEYARVCLMRPDIMNINAEHNDCARLALSEHAHFETSPRSLEVAA